MNLSSNCLSDEWRWVALTTYHDFTSIGITKLLSLVFTKPVSPQQPTPTQRWV